VSLVQAISSSPRAADSLRDFIAERIAPQVSGNPEDRDWRIRRSLIGSQLIGLAFQRYVMRAEPLATAEPGQVAAWAGPVIDRYMHEPLAGVAGQHETAAQ